MEQRGHFSMRKWESENHKSWCMPAEGFKGHVATDGSLLRKRWQVGSMWLGEVQRTVKMAELTAFLCLTRKVCGPIKIHVDNKSWRCRFVVKILKRIT